MMAPGRAETGDNVTNLLSETLMALGHNGLTGGDVRWVGSADGKMAMEWGDFAKIAEGVEYDDGWGSQEVAWDLVVVGDGWWLERSEYDGAEGWEIKRPPVRIAGAVPFRRVAVGSWSSLAELNRPEPT